MVVLRYINLLLCLCLLPLSASSSVRYRTAELKRLSEVLQVQIDSIHELSPLMGTKGIEVVNEAMELSDVSELSKLADQLIMSNEGTVNHS